MTLTEKRMHWILTKSPYNYSQKGLLCALVTYLNRHSECWPTNRTLALNGGITERTVTSYLKMFETDGLISVSYGQRPRGRSSGRILHFHFPDERPSNPDPGPSSEPSGPGTTSGQGGTKQETVSGKGEGRKGLSCRRTGNNFSGKGETVSATRRKSFPAEEVLESKDPKSRKNLIQGLFSGETQGEKQREAPNAQTPDSSAKGLSLASGGGANDDLCGIILNLYREICPGLKPAGTFPDRGRESLDKLVDTYPEARSPEWWRAYFERAARSELLNGGGKRGWKASLGWLLVPWTVKLVLDGHYDDSLGLCG